MQIQAQDYLRLVEEANTLAFFDIEATGLNGDYNSILVISVKPFQSAPTSFVVEQPGNDQRVVREAKDFIEQFDCICGYYSKGFDIKMINTRLLKWGRDPVKPIHHIDMYYTLKYHLNTSRRSQAHMARWLKAGEQKFDVSAEAWSDVIAEPKKHMPTMIKRCESDVTSLQNIYEKSKHVINDIKRG